MKNKRKCLVVTWSVIILVTIFYVPAVIAGSACLTVNNDGQCKTVFKNKDEVWLNTYAGFGPPGLYFFVVLAPGGVTNPNDGATLNLSDDYDAYTNRWFTTPAEGLTWYTGTHTVSSPYIRIYPYADTPNEGGIYMIAVCSLANGYPVEPKDCSYNAFSIKPK